MAVFNRKEEAKDLTVNIQKTSLSLSQKSCLNLHACLLQVTRPSKLEHVLAGQAVATVLGGAAQTLAAPADLVALDETPG